MRTDLSALSIPKNYIYDDLYSVPYSRRIMPSKFGITATAELIAQELYHEVKSARKKEPEILLDGLRNLLTNLILAFKKQKLLAVSLGHSSNFIHGMYGFRYASPVVLKQLIEILESMGYINIYKGYFNKDIKEGRFTRISPTDNLLAAFKGIEHSNWSPKHLVVSPSGLIVDLGQKQFNVQHPAIAILLKDKHRNVIQYQACHIDRSLTDMLIRTNDLMRRTELIVPACMEIENTIDIGGEGEDLTTGYVWGGGISYTRRDSCNNLYYKPLDGQLYRVFNRSSFSYGGRFYGAEYQQLNKEERKTILINSSPVYELDYSSLHIQMLYNLIGVQFVGDPYDLFDEDTILRNGVKLLFNIMLNAKSKLGAISSFNQKLFEDNKLQTLRETLIQKNITTQTLAQIILDSHPKIVQFINSDMGIRLQNKDSMIAMRIIDHFTRKDIPCLCVHDSFIVPLRYKDELESVMKEEYRKEMGFDCDVKDK